MAERGGTMKALMPAHKVIIARIESHNITLLTIGERVDAWMNGQEIGAMCTLLGALGDMIIPEENIDEIVERLRKLSYFHCVTLSTIEKLSGRKLGITISVQNQHDDSRV